MIHAEQLCDQVVMIHRGEKVLDQTIAGSVRALTRAALSSSRSIGMPTLRSLP